MTSKSKFKKRHIYSRNSFKCKFRILQTRIKWGGIKVNEGKLRSSRKICKKLFISLLFSKLENEITEIKSKFEKS